jgi:hypothetical protein
MDMTNSILKYTVSHTSIMMTVATFSAAHCLLLTHHQLSVFFLVGFKTVNSGEIKDHVHHIHHTLALADTQKTATTSSLYKAEMKMVRIKLSVVLWVSIRYREEKEDNLRLKVR